MTVSSAEKFAMVHPNARGEMALDEITYRFMSEVDLVVTEGYKTGNLPRLEVHRAERGSELLCANQDGQILDHRLVGVVSDAQLTLPVPVFPLDDPAPVCDFLEQRCLVGA